MAESKKTTKKSTSTKSTTKKNVAKSATKKAPVKEVKTVKEEKLTKPVEKKEVKAEVKPVEKKIEVKKEVKSSNFIKDNSKNLLLGLICILLVINIVLIVLGHKVKLSNGNEVIASIKDKEYTAEQLFDKLKEKYGKDALITLIDEYISDKELSDDDKADAKTEAKKYIDSIKSQYESAGYTWDDVLKQYGYANEDALINEYLVSVKQQKVVTNYLGKQLTDDEIKKYYGTDKVLELPKSIKSIGVEAFKNCFDIEKIILNEGIKKIDKQAFVNCANLKSVNIPNSLTDIDPTAFMYANNIIEFIVSDDNQYYKAIKGSLYSKDESVLLLHANNLNFLRFCLRFVSL